MVLSLFLFAESAHSQWTSQTSGTSVILYSIDFVTTSTGYACGSAGTILKTTDGGANWVAQVSGTQEALYAIDAFGIAAGYHGTIRRTTDNGNTWLNSNIGTVNYNAVYFLDYNTGYIAGAMGTILKTTNHGASFTTLNTGVTSELYSIDSKPLDANTLVASGDNSTLIKSTNGGSSWVQLLSGTERYSSVSYTSNDLIIICDNNGRLIRSSNGGSNWQFIQSGTTHPLFTIKMVNSVYGFAGGQNGTIQKTFNGGLNWYGLNSGTVQDINRIYAFDILRLYASGTLGLILHTTNGGGDPIGIEPANNEIPKEYSLSQNYPNPFNPSTHFTIKIADFGLVQLKVFDVMGREAAVIVNEMLQPGTYEVEFDAAKLPSGTYFYRITAGKYTESKKMILIK